jgi:polysaccharide chain length determinant protein (PEP-CTERM system associated)
MMQQLENLREQLQGLWRFRWIGMGAAWFVLLFSLLVITVLPNRYAASATVSVNTQTAVSAATRTLTPDENADSQIQLVREALLGGPQLAKIADDTGLTARARTPEERQKVIDKLRGQIQITLRSSGATLGGGTYFISYTNKDRQTSLNVVDRFVNTFVKEALEGKLKGSEQAQQFLKDQIAELEKRLRDAEEALAAFKKEHVGLLPSNQTDYFNRLDTELAELESAQTKLSVAIMRRNELEHQLHGEDPLMPGGAERPGAAGSAPASGTATRLQEAQQQLDELLLNYTEKHPRVIELRNNIAELQKRRDAEVEAARKGDTGAAASSGLAASPVYQNLKLQYDQVGVEIAGLQADIANHHRRVETLRSMMNTAPEVEAQFARLNRDYSVVKAQYEALVEQLGRVHLGAQAAETGLVGFEVVDPPRAGFDPTFPRRPLLAVAALAAALAVGVGVAFLLNALRPTFGSIQRLHRVTGLPVLGAVSMTWIERHEGRMRRSGLRLAGALLGLVLVCGVFLATQRHLANAVKTWALFT